jgi:hypothetical protein
MGKKSTTPHFSWAFTYCSSPHHFGQDTLPGQSSADDLGCRPYSGTEIGLAGMLHYGTALHSHHYHQGSLCPHHKPRTGGYRWCGLHTQIHAASSEMNEWDGPNNPRKQQSVISCTLYTTYNFQTVTYCFVTHLFIWAIRTVQVTITAPSWSYADISWTAELRVWITFGVWTISLIRVISTVVIMVTHPVFLYALSTGASKFVRAAGFIWPCAWKYILKLLCTVYTTV